MSQQVHTLNSILSMFQPSHQAKVRHALEKMSINGGTHIHTGTVELTLEEVLGRLKYHAPAGATYVSPQILGTALIQGYGQTQWSSSRLTDMVASPPPQYGVSRSFRGAL